MMFLFSGFTGDNGTITQIDAGLTAAFEKGLRAKKIVMNERRNQEAVDVILNSLAPSRISLEFSSDVRERKPGWSYKQRETGDLIPVEIDNNLDDSKFLVHTEPK